MPSSDTIHPDVQKQLDRLSDFFPEASPRIGDAHLVHRMTGEEITIWRNGSWTYTNGTRTMHAHGSSYYSLVELLLAFADSQTYRSRTKKRKKDQ